MFTHVYPCTLQGNTPEYGCGGREGRLHKHIPFQCFAHTGRQWLSPTTTPLHPTMQYSALPNHHSFYRYIYRSSLSSYVRVAIVHLAIFFLRPIGHGSSHARSRSTRLHAMIESSENVHYIELSNLWVGKAQGVHVRARACVLCIIQ